MLEIRQLVLKAGEFQLRQVSLRVKAGEYFVLMGPTGSGKSLLIKSICGILRPSGGQIVLDGRDVTCLWPRDRHVGYLPQEGGLFPHLNVRDNLVFSLRLAGLSVEQALAKVAPLVETLGLAGMMERSVTTLSGGETQKVALGRALARQPKLLLLDEPASALDGPTRVEVCRLLRDVQRRLGISTVHVCHNLSETAALADRVGVMIEGGLVQVGTLAELLAAPAAPAVARLMAEGGPAHDKAGPPQSFPKGLA